MLSLKLALSLEDKARWVGGLAESLKEAVPNMVIRVDLGCSCSGRSAKGSASCIGVVNTGSATDPPGTMDSVLMKNVL